MHNTPTDANLIAALETANLAFYELDALARAVSALVYVIECDPVSDKYGDDLSSARRLLRMLSEKALKMAYDADAAALEIPS